MNPLVPLLALPFCLAAGLALAWLRHRLPPGWKGVGLGLGALAGLSMLAFGGWMLSLSLVTWGEYACTDCGRLERQTHIGSWTVSSRLERDGEEYVKRFAPDLLRGHAHHWHLESCLFSPGGVGCTMQSVEGWFRVLPRLTDRAAADALAAEAKTLPREERCRLMDEITSAVWHREKEPGGIDAAFERWRARQPAK
jgi:hypothetical protein